MSKRAKGEGSIRKHSASGKWLVEFPTNRHKENGKKEYIYKYCDSQEQARDELMKLHSERNPAGRKDGESTKTGDWLDHWIEDIKAKNTNTNKNKRRLAKTTLTSYRNNARIHIIPEIGDIALRDLTTDDIQAALDKIKGSLSTFIKNYNVLHGALEAAVDEGLILRNPCKGVAFPDEEEKEMKVMTKEEQQRFIKALDGEYYRVMFLTYLYSGMRIGEGIPLTWEDIDLKERTITVNKKAVVVHDFNSHSAKQEVQNKCKTKSSKRTIMITAGLVDILTEHKAEMIRLAENMGEKWSEKSLVFRNSHGNMVYSRNLQCILKRILEKAGIKNVTMHTLRHTYATRCFEAGVEIKAISEQLGHINVKTTYNTYIHLLKDTKAKEIAKLEGIDQLLDAGFKVQGTSAIVNFMTGERVG